MKTTRLIDADALTDKYGDWYTEEGTEEGFIGCLKQLIDEQPTIDAEPHWIPVSEKLPEFDVKVAFISRLKKAESIGMFADSMMHQKQQMDIAMMQSRRGRRND